MPFRLMKFRCYDLSLILCFVLFCVLFFVLSSGAKGDDSSTIVSEEFAYEPDITSTGGDVVDDFANKSWKTVTFYLKGETSVESLGGGMVKVKYGQLNTTKPNQTQDTSVPCPSMYGKIPKSNTYYIVGGFTSGSFLGNVSRWGMNIELWATGHAKKVQFLIVKGQEGYVTDEKDVDGPTKFTLTYLGYKEKSAYYMDFLIYYRTPQLQIPPSVSLIYGTPEHNANLKTNITCPMKAQYSNITVSDRKVTFTAIMWDGFGMYDLVNYSLNIHGPQKPKSIKETSKRVPGALYNITYEVEYEKTDDQNYTLHFVCVDNNGNTWETNRSDNNSFILKQSYDFGLYGLFGGAVIVLLIITAVWWKFGKPSKSLMIKTQRLKNISKAPKH